MPMYRLALFWFSSPRGEVQIGLIYKFSPHVYSQIGSAQSVSFCLGYIQIGYAQVLAVAIYRLAI